MTKNSMVPLTIDGREIEVPADTLVVEAARRLDIEIPVFCYHPKLDPVGMCRMCLVEVGTPRRGPDGQLERDAQGKPVIAMLPKPQTACTLPVAEGMLVRSSSEAVADARRAVIEFLLISHPLDCPVCDKGVQGRAGSTTRTSSISRSPSSSAPSSSWTESAASYVPVALASRRRSPGIQCWVCQIAGEGWRSSPSPIPPSIQNSLATPSISARWGP
ncbi:MAG: (2Fe-2S)-binding protein [Chloroflexi bacterium]|nr:(2Fe-2S)-binding protein [Chloroflexota bacterium]